jgi:hypothetical protein
MTKIRTHSFKNGKYAIEEIDGLLRGVCEIPDDGELLYIIVPEENTQRSLQTVIHEALHANGLPSKYLDEEHDVAEAVGRFLWRLGWRRTA